MQVQGEMGMDYTAGNSPGEFLGSNMSSQDGVTGIGQSMRGPTMYEVLSVEPNATKMAIREAFLRLKNTFGTGNAALYSLMTEEEARANIASIEDAYRILNDETRRAEYDRSLGLDWEHRNARLSDIPGAERIAIADEQFAGNIQQNQGFSQESRQDAASKFSQVIQTTRSTLNIVKTTADNARNDTMQSRVTTLIAEGDAGDGDLYRRIREAIGVSEAEMQDRTKISREYLRAIETNRFEQLPQSVYVKGFLRSYFKYLAVADGDKFVLDYAARLEAWQQSRKN